MYALLDIEKGIKNQSPFLYLLKFPIIKCLMLKLLSPLEYKYGLEHAPFMITHSRPFYAAIFVIYNSKNLL